MLRVLMKLLRRNDGEARVSIEQQEIEQRLDAVLKRVQREDRAYSEREADRIRRGIRV